MRPLALEILLFFLIFCGDRRQQVQAYGYYRDTIPNGRSVPCPSEYCSGICAGFGHINDDGSPGCSGGSHPLHPLNQFGDDWQKFGTEWNYAMCTADSDGDGYTNGDELGDPCCIWSAGTPPSRTTKITHPGIATTSSFKSCKNAGVPAFSISTKEVGTSSATLVWSSNSSSCICSVDFQFSIGVLSASISQSINTGQLQSINLTALDPGTEYSATVSAYNLAGTSSIIELVFSTLEVNANAPPIPEPPACTPQSTSLECSWSSVDAGLQWQLDLRRENMSFGGVAYIGPLLSYTIQSLEPNTKYYVRLRGISSFGEGYPSAEATYTTTSVNNSASHGFVSDDGAFSVYWTIVGDEITFDVTGATTGWVGLGIGSTPTMLNSDVFMGGFDGASGTGYLNDRWSSDRNTPSIDKSQDLTLLSSSETTDKTKISFSRKLDTGDADADIPIAGKDMYLIWGIGSTDSGNSKSVPTHTKRGAVLVNFMSGKLETLDIDTLKNTHGALNFISWLILLPLGSIIARYFRVTLPLWWFRYHVILQATGFVLNFIGFVLAFVAVREARTGHFANAHSYLGLFLFIFSLFQSGLGLLSHFKYNPKRKRTPFFPDIVHRWVGVGSLVLGFVTVFLGFHYHHVTSGTWYLGAITIAYSLFAVLVLEFF